MMVKNGMTKPFNGGIETGRWVMVLLKKILTSICLFG